VMKNYVYFIAFLVAELFKTKTLSKRKMPYLLLQSLIDFIELVLCNVHIRSHSHK